MKRVMDAEHHQAHHEHHEEHHDFDKHHHHRHGSRGAWLKGFLFGGVAGLVASLLVAPQSGRQTRDLLRYKSVQFRQLAEQTAVDTRDKVQQLSSDARRQAQDLQRRSAEKLGEQKERVTRVATAVKDAARESWQQPAGTGQPGNGQQQSTPESESIRAY